jgi:ubiquinone/menaquinone biosynthesis C-methylase UbiE
MVDQTWIVKQSKYNVSQWDNSMELRYPETKMWNKDAHSYYQRVCEECNFYDAVRIIEWKKYLPDNAKILDLGCGGGWLSAYLSKIDCVQSIYSLDSSENYLTNIMPEVIKIMQGSKEKITTIEGMFTPLLISDNSLDMVVASAAVHHAENLEGVLREIRNKIKLNGHLILLNETPSPYFRYLLRLCLAFSKIMVKTVMQKYESSSPKISTSGFEYDPFLGDKSYPFWYWEKALHRAGFEILEHVDSNLSTVKGMNGITLKHIICKAI